jgi:tetratricopeptide (TPR) repeat protein
MYNRAAFFLCRAPKLIDPSSDPDTLAAEAVRHLSTGDLAAAELACRTALGVDAGNISAGSSLGAVLLTQGRFGEALDVYADLTQRQPDAPPHWINLGNARRGMRDYDQALLAYARAAALGIQDADFYFNVGLTHLDRGDFESARQVLQKARELDSLDAEITLRYAGACYRLLDNDTATAALLGWRTLAPASPGVLALIGQLLVNLGQPAEGQAAVDEALAHPQADAVTLLTAIEVAERLNQLPQAEALVRRLESSPHSAAIDSDLLIIRARLAQRGGDYETAEKLYQQSLLANDDPAQKHMELFPLAQTLDAQGRYREAADMLRQAHSSQLQYLRRVAPALVLSGAPPMMIAREGCDPADVAAWGRDAPVLEDSPIFIVAFPRSGTTLLELVLDAHPALQSMDEQPFIQDALDEMRAHTSYPNQLAALSGGALAEIRANYWRRVSGRIALRPGARLVDKNPLNILRLPVIARLFPRSPILLAVRHPCDIILSCYMQHFRAPEFALLCNSVPSIARGYRMSTDFWYGQSELLHPKVLEVRYETLVTDFEREVRGIMQFLELPWDDRVLQPQKRAEERGFISTPSYSQVVRPVTSTSVDRWQHYAPLLTPVIPIVQPQLDRWGYAAVVAVDGVSPNSK